MRVVAQMKPLLADRSAFVTEFRSPPTGAEFRSPSTGPTQRLDDARIAEVLHKGFAPHRCVVTFQDDGARVALQVWSLDGREFAVEGKRIDSLRDPAALREYLKDIRFHLKQRKVHLNNT